MSFIAPDDLRQRIKPKPTLVSSSVSSASEEPEASGLITNTKPIAYSNDEEWTKDPIVHPASYSTTFERDETVTSKLVEIDMNREEVNAVDSNENGLRAAYIDALRAAIRKHWSYQGPPKQCSLNIQQLPGGTVQSAIAGECSLPTQDRHALEAAVLMAQPLPYEGFEAIFQIQENVEIL